MTETSSRQGVAVLEKALDIIERLADGTPWSVAQLAASTGMNKTSVYRIVTTLQRRGFVTRDLDHATYRAGPMMLAVSRLYLTNTKLANVASPVLSAVHKELEETVNLGGLQGDRIRYIDMIESQHGLRMTARVGSSGPVHATAIGKAILAAMNADEARQIISATERQQLTPKTITNVMDLIDELNITRDRGYAIDDEESELGARCVAVAVLDQNNRPVAGLSCSAPTWRLPDRTLTRVAETLHTATRKIETLAGYRPEQLIPPANITASPSDPLANSTFVKRTDGAATV